MGLRYLTSKPVFLFNVNYLSKKPLKGKAFPTSPLYCFSASIYLPLCEELNKVGQVMNGPTIVASVSFGRELGSSCLGQHLSCYSSEGLESRPWQASNFLWPTYAQVIYCELGPAILNSSLMLYGYPNRN